MQELINRAKELLADGTVARHVLGPTRQKRLGGIRHLGKTCIAHFENTYFVSRAETVFNALCQNDTVKKITDNEYETIIFSRGAWHLAKYDTESRRMKADKDPFCYAFALSDVEHDKSTSYPNVYNIVFDEFLTRRYYLPDEFVIFMNVLSTIIRDRENIKIFMLGNTVNKYCPYFDEMGLNNIEQMKQGNIDVYSFGNELKIAVEYCNPTKDGKKSNKYFAFDNPRLNMITKGAWELAIYPHLPQGYKIKPNNIIFSFIVDKVK